MTKMIPKCKAKVIIILFFYIHYYRSKFYKPECFPQSKYAVFYWQVISDLEQQVSLLLSWGRSSNTVREAESIKEINHSMNNFVTEIIIRDTVQFRETLDLRQGLLQITALSFISHKFMFRSNLFFNKYRTWILIFNSLLPTACFAIFLPLHLIFSRGPNNQYCEHREEKSKQKDLKQIFIRKRDLNIKTCGLLIFYLILNKQVQ